MRIKTYVSDISILVCCFIAFFAGVTLNREYILRNEEHIRNLQSLVEEQGCTAT